MAEKEIKIESMEDVAKGFGELMQEGLELFDDSIEDTTFEDVVENVTAQQKVLFNKFKRKLERDLIKLELQLFHQED